MTAEDTTGFGWFTSEEGQLILKSKQGLGG